ncbi:metal ABC transporter solute-binding protein, Zn/Mn family [Olivibacter domesticus]|uniref:Manganese/zinc/iron transport system substrate-binding protein n=1 Tax=Olivibacter domesticus TaxID=407022 RepID=A0A1H7IVZ0_OLID1|nr:zinc ABC transporter substrate-binding protein [Olivibacter domesticus]SEK64955.1 manganese/zinc/iron transport system substrate-binding protein [Olivibacter domesticus]
MRNLYQSFGILLLCLFWGGCTQVPEKKDRLYIVTTTGILADAVKNIVKDSAYVQTIMGAGVDPHVYKASQGDLEKFLQADLIIYGGLHLEGKLTEVLNKLGRTRPVLGVGDELPKALVRTDSSFATAVDPHIWFDIKIWAEVVDLIAKKIISLDKKHANFYKANASSYIETLLLLDKEVKNMISAIPVHKRVMITAHDAFNYFGSAYNIEVMGLQGISTTAEFGLRDVSKLVTFILERQINAIFLETSVSDRAIKAVIAGVNEKGGKLLIGGNLFSDAMGASGTPEGTYIGMVKHNVNTIVKALK